MHTLLELIIDSIEKNSSLLTGSRISKKKHKNFSLLKYFHKLIRFCCFWFIKLLIKYVKTLEALLFINLIENVFIFYFIFFAFWERWKLMCQVNFMKSVDACNFSILIKLSETVQWKYVFRKGKLYLFQYWLGEICVHFWAY